MNTHGRNGPRASLVNQNKISTLDKTLIYYYIFKQLIIRYLYIFYFNIVKKLNNF